MITPAFNLTATERVLPKLALDFTTASLDPRITFTRTTDATRPATYIGSDGYVASATNNQARFDYDPVTLACKGLLIEESRTNLTTSSSVFQSGWTLSNVGAVDNSTATPSNTTTACLLSSNNAATPHYAVCATAVSITSGATYTQSIFVKQGTNSVIQLLFTSTLFGLEAYANFNISSGTSGTAGTNATAKITPYANGFYRISLTSTATATGSGTAALIAFCNNNASAARAPNYVDSSASNVYIWGAQLEVGAFATSYIPTTTTALTRSADVSTITGTAFSGFWRSGPGSTLARALPSTVSGTRPLVQVDDATADNIIALRGNTTNPELYIRAGGADQATIDAGTISAAAYRLAGAWQAGSAAASLNSGLAVNGAPASIPAATQMRLGSDGTNYLNGHLQAVEYWPLRLSNASLQNASSTAGYQSIIHPVSRDTIITEPV